MQDGAAQLPDAGQPADPLAWRAGTVDEGAFTGNSVVHLKWPHLLTANLALRYRTCNALPTKPPGENATCKKTVAALRVRRVSYRHYR
jgi:hypothetical protein